ncbi:hypothetical protein L596_024865 [Steinernema carpocapsae]|uniref:Palmitoyltransferase n=1 Tax=Steinernema carpocapsae TaxID=34508 RepID=A0A4U5M625_STECR|nr:hypothetical protein L596_024865 [Steinernema carpocapsae]
MGFFLALAAKITIPAWIFAFHAWYLFFTVSYCAVLVPVSTTPAAVALLVQAFNFIWITAIVSLFRASYYPPEPIPDHFKIPKELLKEENVIKAIGEWSEKRMIPARFRKQPSNNGDVNCPKFCARCFIVKPDRAHHCGTCGTCVMRMDHHCPVLANCVHYGNHRFFINFLVSSIALCVFATTVCFPQVYVISMDLIYTTAFNDYDYPHAYTCVASGIFNAVVCTFALGFFLRNLCSQMRANETTLESMMRSDYGDEDVFRDGRSDYSLGSAAANYRSFMGSAWNWFMPYSFKKKGNPSEYKYKIVEFSNNTE